MEPQVKAGLILGLIVAGALIIAMALRWASAIWSGVISVSRTDNKRLGEFNTQGHQDIQGYPRGKSSPQALLPALSS